MASGTALPDVDPRGRIKGNAILAFLTWFERHHGSARILGAMEGLSPPDREMFTPGRPGLGILPSVWYPASVVHRTLDGMTVGMSREELDTLADEGGAATVRTLMRGVQGIVFALFMTPARYGAFVQKLWNLNYDSGTAENRVLSPTRHETLTRGWRGHHPLLCRMNSAVRVTLYEAVGCRNVVVEQRFCILRGDPACGSRVHWEA